MGLAALFILFGMQLVGLSIIVVRLEEIDVLLKEKHIG